MRKVGSRSISLLLPLLCVGVLASCAGSDDNNADSLPQDDTAAQDVASDVADTVSTDTLSDVSADASDTFTPVEPHIEEMAPYSIVWLAGTPYEMGKQHGELLHDSIADAMEFVAQDDLLSKIPVLAESMGIIDIAMDNSYQDILDECQGLVDATSDVGFTMDFCLALNFGDVMLEFMESGIPTQEFPAPGCSGVIARGEATPDGILRHTRNLDWGSMDITVIHQHPVIFVRQPSDGIPHVYVGFPLNLSPYTGMNLAGISIGSHEAEPLDKTQDSNKGRSHVQMLGQLLKRAHNFTEAEAFIRSQQHMSTEILVVADGPNKDGGVFEMTGKGLAVRKLESDVVWATNHFVDPQMAAIHAEPGEGSLGRFQRFSQLVPPDGKDSIWGELDQTGLARVMRDTVLASDGSQPTDEELEAMDWDNDVGIGSNGPMHFAIFEPESHLFWVAAGKLPIHKQPYKCFSLEELLGLEVTHPCPGDIQVPDAQ